MTDFQLRQSAIDVLCRELKLKRPSKTRCEIALAVLTELRETVEDSQPPEWVQQLLAETALENERERRNKGRDW